MIEKEEKYMRRCFALAQNGLGNVAPNPLVGAVIVARGRIIGEGYHRQWGGPHAEVNAIASVKEVELLKEATMYVNLEPCSHYGKTPPCAQLLIDKQIPRVVVANVDPFPQVSGRGIGMLRAAGIEVEHGFLEEEGWELNRRFFTFHTQHRPYIILKWAQSADGYMALKGSEDRLKISSPISQMMMHKLRAEETAIMVGTETAVADDPQLTARCYNSHHNPVRVLVDRTLRVPAFSRIFDNSAPTVVFTERAVPPSGIGGNVEWITAPFSGRNVDLGFLLSTLYDKGLQSLLVEGGQHIHSSFLSAGLTDEIRVETNMALTVGDGLKAAQRRGTLISQQLFDNNLVQVYRVKNGCF